MKLVGVLVAALCLLIPRYATSQIVPSTSPATSASGVLVERDFFLLKEDGQVSRRAGEVILLVDREAVKYTIAEECDTRNPFFRGGPESAEYQGRLRRVKAAVVSEAKANVDGHFKFQNVKPGRYYLYALTFLGGSEFQMIKAVDVADSAVNVDMNNENITVAHFCLKRAKQ